MKRDLVGMMISTPEAPDEALDLARSIESAGFQRAWLAETTTMEVAGVGAAITSGTALQIGTSIVPVFSRSPAVLAMMVATWAGLGGVDREIRLGIGAGGQVIVEKWHGVPFERPAKVVEETIGILRQAFAGESTSFTGEVRASQGFRLGAGELRQVRIYIGGMGPRMRRLAAEIADGLILTWISPRIVRLLEPAFRESVASAGRERSDSRLITRAYVAITDDVAAVREGVRRELLGYLVSPPYARYFRSVGFEDEVDQTIAAFERGDRDGTAAAVSEAMLDELLLAGDAKTVQRRLDEYLAAGADELIVQPVAAEFGGDPERTITELGRQLED